MTHPLLHTPSPAQRHIEATLINEEEVASEIPQLIRSICPLYPHAYCFWVFLPGGTFAALLHDVSMFSKMDEILVWEGVVEEVRMISIPSLVVWLEDGQV